MGSVRQCRMGKSRRTGLELRTQCSRRPRILTKNIKVKIKMASKFISSIKVILAYTLNNKSSKTTWRNLKSQKFRRFSFELAMSSKKSFNLIYKVQNRFLSFSGFTLNIAHL